MEELIKALQNLNEELKKAGGFTDPTNYGKNVKVKPSIKGSGVKQKKLADLFPNMPYTAKKEKMSFHKNGQWHMEKYEPTKPVDFHAKRANVPDKIKPGSSNA